MNTLDNTLIACVDWFSATFFNIENYEDVCRLLFLNPDNFELRESGKFGYLKTASLGSIRIYYGATQDNMGIHLEMSGSACREYELGFGDDKLDWSDFFRYVLGCDMQVTRLDLALDDFEQRFKLTQIKTKITTGCVVSPFKKGRSFEEYLLKDGNLVGNTIYFGKGDVLIRFYDKYQERINKGYSLNADIDSWQRTELQIRHDRAMEAVKLMANTPQDLGKFIAGILKRYLKFKIKGVDSNRSRWKDAKWWTKFLADAETVKLTQVSPEKTILKTKDWIDTQVAGSLATVYEAIGDDKLFIEYIIKLGKDKMNDSQKEMANEFRRDLRKRIALKEELREAVKRIEERKVELQ